MRAILLPFLVLLAAFNARATLLPALPDIFLELPAEYLSIADSKTGKPYSRDEKRKLITLVDAKNGYLEARGNDNTDIFGGAELALFKTKAGSYLIGLHIDSNGDGTENILILTRTDKGWSDVTAQVLPKITSAMVDEEAQARVPALKKQTLK